MMQLFTPEARERNLEYSYPLGWQDFLAEIDSFQGQGWDTQRIMKWLQQYLPRFEYTTEEGRQNV